MWAALRTLAAFGVVLAVGALLGSAVTQWRTSSPSADSAAAPLQPQIGERIRVEVLNAGGRSRMARRATDILRSRGFDVVYFGNADRFGQDSSRVLDRVGRADAARAVARALGISRVETEPDRNLHLEVTVRLGSDWEPAAAAAPSPAAEGTDGWRLPGWIRELGR